MDFKLFGKEGAESLLLIPGLGVSYEIFLPLIELLKDRFRIKNVFSEDQSRDRGDGTSFGTRNKRYALERKLCLLRKL